MERSIGKLVEALAKAQGELKGAKEDSGNSFYKSKYADLTEVWSACREALSANGIAVIQAPVLMNRNREGSEDYLVLRTTLAHSSGEFVEGFYPVEPIKKDPQGYGSALTYARRYSLASMVGVAPKSDDDDGERAGKADSKTKVDNKPKEPPAAPDEADQYLKYLHAVEEAVTKKDKNAGEALSNWLSKTNHLTLKQIKEKHDKVLAYCLKENIG